MESDQVSTSRKHAGDPRLATTTNKEIILPPSKHRTQQAEHAGIKISDLVT